MFAAIGFIFKLAKKH